MKIVNAKIANAVFLIAIFLICCKIFYTIFFQTNAPTVSTASLGISNSINQVYPLYLSVLSAKAVIPEDSPIEIAPFGFNIYRLAARYLLSPLPISKDWVYFIDFDHSVEYPYPTWQIYDLPTGVRIFAKPGYEILADPKSIVPYSPLKISMIFLAVVILNLGFGVLLLHLLNYYKVSQKMFWVWGASHIVGMLLFTIFLWLFLLLGGKLETDVLTIIWVMASLILLVIAKREKPETQEDS